MLVILLFAELLLPSYGSVPIILDRAEQSSNYWPDKKFAPSAIDGKQNLFYNVVLIQMNNKSFVFWKKRGYIL